MGYANNSGTKFLLMVFAISTIVKLGSRVFTAAVSLTHC